MTTIQNLLLERYPELSFLLTCREEASSQTPEVAAEFVVPDLTGVDILYVYGLEGGSVYPAVKPWLQQRRERALVFLEDDLARIDQFLSSDLAEEILTSPQIHLRFVASTKLFPQVLEECAQQFPCDRIEVVAVKKTRRLKQIRLQLMRNVSSIQAQMSEALYAHKLLENLLPNFKLWPKAFYGNALKGKFAGIPAIICGAGPSLKEALVHLKALETKALIFAGGSTIAALSNQGILPHFSLALDPNAEEYPRLKASCHFEGPLLYANRLLADVFNTCNGPLGYLKTDTGGSAEMWMEEKLNIQGEPIGPDLGREALSVTTLAIALAAEMGCNPILLNGVDLAYTGMQRYAAGVLPAEPIKEEALKKQTRAPERFLRRKDIHGHPVYTLVKWVMESECIAAYAKRHPEITFINTSSGGLGFPHIPNRPLAEVMEEYCTKSYDLRAQIHVETENLRFKEISSAQIDAHLRDLASSLERCLRIACQMLEELSFLRSRVSEPNFTLQTGKIILLESDFEEEIAFESLLQLLGPALDRLLSRTHDPVQSSKEQLIDRQVSKWKQFKSVIESELTLLLPFGSEIL